MVGLALAWSRCHPEVPMVEMLERSTFSCGTVALGSYGRHPWVIRNRGSSPLRIRTRFTSGRSGFSLWQGAEHVVEPGASLTVSLTWVTPGRPSEPFASYATLRTNDPQWPEFRLRVVGKSEPADPPASAGPVSGHRP